MDVLMDHRMDLQRDLSRAEWMDVLMDHQRDLQRDHPRGEWMGVLMDELRAEWMDCHWVLQMDFLMGLQKESLMDQLMGDQKAPKTG